MAEQVSIIGRHYNIVNYPADELTLVKAAQQGDDDAFRELVSIYKNYVYSMIMRQVADGGVAEDLAQEVFIKVYNGLANFKGDSTFKTWLTKITLNTTYTYFNSSGYKKGRVTHSLDLEQDSKAESSLKSFALDEDPIEQSQFMSGLKQCFSALSQEMQSVMALCGFEGQTYQEVALTLNVPVGTVRSRLNRARISIMECLKVTMPEGY